MSKVDDELTRQLQRAARPVEGDGLFEGLVARRSHRDRVRRIQAGLLGFAVVAATAGGFAVLRDAFDADVHRSGESPSPAVLRANGQIVFVRDDAEDGVTHLFTMHADGTHARQLTDFATGDRAPAVSPDGSTVAFVRELEDLTPVIASIPIDGGAVTRLTDKRLFVSGSPAWSPDGSRIAFAAHDGDGQRLFVMNADGSDVRPITDPDRFWVTGAAWSPDGTRIGFTGSIFDDKGETASSDIFTVRADGNDLVNVTQTPAAKDDEVGPTWSPDGSRIAFNETSGRSIVLVVHNLADGTERTITEGHVDDGPAWSPDGSLIAFNRSPLDGGGFNVWVVRPDGSGLTRLTRDGGFNPAWQPLPTGSDPSPSATPEPSIPPEPEPAGHDIGLGVRMCHLEVLEGVDWDGSGIDGAAWTGAPVDEDGRCSSASGVQHVVAVDRDGDGIAEQGSTSTLRSCLLCQPFDTVDLNDDGVLELVVLEEASSTPTYSVFEVNRPGSERSPGVYPIIVVAPGAPAMNLDKNEEVRFTVGGDEGFSGSIVCEDAGAGAPILRYTWVRGAVDADSDLRVDITRVSFGEDGVFHIESIDRFGVPRNPEPIDLKSTEPACGVDFHPAA
jgi:Tol biopolymer transport system component